MIDRLRFRGNAAALMMLVMVLAAPTIAAVGISASETALVTAEPPPAPPALRDLVTSFVDYGNRDPEQDCLAKAVYFEARGESLEGQLAVAEVVLNRTASATYPASICEVVTQPAQFSFIRQGRFPKADENSKAWRNAVAISEIARREQVDLVPSGVLWYHATYVAPSWGPRLTRAGQIGAHIFYS